MSVKLIVEKLVGSFDDKRRWWAYRARRKQLPVPYRKAIEALERYVTVFGAMTKGDVLVSMLEDLAELFEQGAANGTSIRGIVGNDPVEFAEEFLRNYSEGKWINKERARLTEAIYRAVSEEA